MSQKRAEKLTRREWKAKKVARFMAACGLSELDLSEASRSGGGEPYCDTLHQICARKWGVPMDVAEVRIRELMRVPER